MDDITSFDDSSLYESSWDNTSDYYEETGTEDKSQSARIAIIEKQRQPLLSTLVRSQIMKVVWSNHKLDLTIGFIKQSDVLKEKLEEGELDELFQKLSETYRDIYGYSPWGEFLSCQDADCSGTQSIEDVYPELQGNYKPLTELPSIEPEDFCCPECKGEMEYFYDPDIQLSTLKKGFQEKIFATLLFKGESEIQGFSLGWETTLEKGWKDKEIEGNGDQSIGRLSYTEYQDEIDLYIPGKHESNSRFFNSAEWAVSHPARKSGASIPLYQEKLRSTLASMQEEHEDIPVIGHSLEGSKALSIFQKIGFHAGKTARGSEERRVYSTLKNLVAGIDGLKMRSSLSSQRPTVLPISREAAGEKPQRNTLVLEMLCDEAVGSDADGDEKIHRYLSELAALLGLNKQRPSVTHLSPKYGLSGWLPLEGSHAVHLYAWDHEDEPYAPFLSIDISTPGMISNEEVIRKHAESFFKAHTSTEKSLQDESKVWTEIADHILRQRISMSGKTDKNLTPNDVRTFLKDLAPALNMVQLSEPLIMPDNKTGGYSGWIHWETSGVVLSWTDEKCEIDIYTCKAFNPADAISFTREKLNLSDLKSVNY